MRKNNLTASLFSESPNMTGINHVRYDHQHRPTLLHLVCPKCNGRCVAQKPSEANTGALAGDCTAAWITNDWAVACEHCHYRTYDQSYRDLPDIFYQVEARGGSLWAWNKEHLIMLLKLLRNDSLKGDQYEWYATYARKEWLQKKNRSSFIKSIERFLENEAC